MFPVPKIVVFDVTVVPDVVPDVPCLRHIVCTSLPAVLLSLWTPILFPVPKILVIDVTVVLDVVLDVTLLKILSPCHPHCPHGHCGPQLWMTCR